MFELLFYSSLTCPDAIDIINNVKKHDDMDGIVKNELVLTIKESTPHCNWDAND